MRSLLKEFVETFLLNEVVDTSKLALTIPALSGVRRTDIVLWDPHALRSLLQNAGQDGVRSLEVMAADEAQDWIVGFMSLAGASQGEQWNGREVLQSAANQGYGPVMYDIALANFGPIFSDRASVSPDARRVWDFYMKRRSDVEKLPFDDIEDPKTPPELDDSPVYRDGKDNPLNYAYRAKGWKVNIKALKGNAYRARLDIERAYPGFKFDSMIANAVDVFFSAKYRGRSEV